MADTVHRDATMEAAHLLTMAAACLADSDCAGARWRAQDAAVLLGLAEDPAAVMLWTGRGVLVLTLPDEERKAYR